MSNIAIRIENLGKRYFIGQGKIARYETLSDQLTGILTSPIRSIHSVLRGQSSAVATDSIWALKDVSFEVQYGEVIGIIGRNGAGKSTLLKILSQITEPTSGYIDIYGRVGALLEVGTGFHPELTGRENVYLNGAILGMKRTEIKRKFDEIVDFSGVEKFIDTPVKYYSSGMQVRLAFAVAAHLEPEILIVDEVLAVGDAEFQKKCLGKMQDATGQGRTVLFVSHNMQAVRHLCPRTILLEQGHIIDDGKTPQVIRQYFSSQNNTDNKWSLNSPQKGGKNKDAVLTHVRFLNDQGQVCHHASVEETLRIIVGFTLCRTVKQCNISMAVLHAYGEAVFSEMLADAREPEKLGVGTYEVEIAMELKYFKEEPYSLVVYLLDGTQSLDKTTAISLPEIYAPRQDSFVSAHRWGVVRIPITWSSIHALPAGNLDENVF